MKLRRCCLPNHSTTFRHGPSGHISSGLASARARAPLNFITSAIGRGHLVQHHNIILVFATLISKARLYLRCLGLSGSFTSSGFCVAHRDYCPSLIQLPTSHSLFLVQRRTR